MDTKDEGHGDAGSDGSAGPSPANGGGPKTGTRFSAEEIYENVRTAAEEEFERPTAALFWSAFAAGLTIGFSCLAAAIFAALEPGRWRSLASAIGYALGFIFVVLARNQLFTENTLEPVIPYLNRPTARNLGRLLGLWAIVLLGNVLGAIAFSGALARTSMVPPDVRSTIVTLAATATDGGFVHVFYMSIFAGWLVGLMAWLVASTRSTGAQVALVWLTTAPIAVFGFRHSVVGAVEASFRVWSGSASAASMFVDFLVPSVLGNIVGGVLLVALLNHSQVVAGRAGHRREMAES